MKGYLELLCQQLKNKDNKESFRWKKKTSFHSSHGGNNLWFREKILRPQLRLLWMNLGLKSAACIERAALPGPDHPKTRDTIIFTSNQPVLLKRFNIGTGHFEYPINKLSEATVEILLSSSETATKNFVVTSDYYLAVGKFDPSGLAEGIIDCHCSRTVQRLRVKLHCDHQEWIIIIELLFEAVPLTDERSSSEEDLKVGEIKLENLP